jgi:hypothetical protein
VLTKLTAQRLEFCEVGVEELVLDRAPQRRERRDRGPRIRRLRGPSRIALSDSSRRLPTTSPRQHNSTSPFART